jgi:hypothetical protein
MEEEVEKKRGGEGEYGQLLDQMQNVEEQTKIGVKVVRSVQGVRGWPPNG